MADIRLNADQWNDLPSESKDAITNLLRDSTLLKEGDSIVGSKDVSSQSTESWIPPRICRAGCDVAEVAVVAACASIPGGIVAIVACQAAAHVAGDECRRAC